MAVVLCFLQQQQFRDLIDKQAKKKADNGTIDFLSVNDDIRARVSVVLLFADAYH